VARPEVAWRLGHTVEGGWTTVMQPWSPGIWTLVGGLAIPLPGNVAGLTT
jgi:hypothetical protein